MLNAKKILLIVILASLVLVSGCAEQPQEIKEITIPGHGNQVYTFENDIREALKVPVNSETGVGILMSMYDHYTIVFDGSDMQDNAYFRVVLINLGKIPIFYAYEGKAISFEYFYYIGDQWYNETDGEIKKPDFSRRPTIWLKGPSTGANETSLTLENNILYLQGTSYKNLTLAGDKLTLIVFGIKSV